MFLIICFDFFVGTCCQDEAWGKGQYFHVDIQKS